MDKAADRSTLKHTKILATVGPAINSREKLREVILAGANGLRMNFSHGTFNERDEQLNWIRDISREVGRNVAILQDIQGPKIRLGMLKDDMRLDVKKGEELGLTFGIEHDGGLDLPTQYDLSKRVKVGETIYLFDGKIRTVVTSIDGATVKVRVENDGYLMSKKAINLPDTDFAGDVITDKDRADIEFGATRDFDYVSLSFVHHASDVEMLRDLLKSLGSTARIISKIETKHAISGDNLEEIVKASDGVMVARGDLAVEAGAEVVPIVQRKIVELCQKHCKFSIVATQMLGSMVENPEPTRAEVSDVATAAIEGADVVMLSDETANGKYPVEAVSAMRKVLLYTQRHMPSHAIYKREGSDKCRDAIAMSAVMLSEQMHADAIIVESKTGNMARNVAIHRPNRPIIAVTGDSRVAQQTSLIYASRGYQMENGEQRGIELAQFLANSNFFGRDVATVVVVKHFPPASDKSIANTVQLLTLQKEK